MDNQRLFVVHLRQQIFCPSPQAVHPAAFQALREMCGERNPKVGAPCFRLDDSVAFEHRLEASADGFDLREFRHDSNTVCSRPMSNAPEATVPFGFRDVPEGDKNQLVRDVFSSVASRYDLMNDLMSGGVHRLWKDAMVEWLNPQPRWHILDVAGGTGDIAIRLSECIRARGGGPDVLVCDVNIGMIAEAMRRAKEKGEAGIQWVIGDAEALPVADASMDAYTIAFGIQCDACRARVG